MNSRIAALEGWIQEPEGENLEFKEAKQNFHFDKLVKYCAALSNEGGGKVILGVNDKRPRKIVGTAAFQAPEHTVAPLIDRLRIKIRAEEIKHPNGRVLVFHVASRPIGMAGGSGRRLSDASGGSSPAHDFR